jgi:peptidoglycan/xylan/chitin deacetylase (PgdA/CDA1 family)
VALGTILTYHAVEDRPPGSDPYRLCVSPALFARQLEFLRRKRDVASLEAVVQRSVRSLRPSVAITFDDGYASVLDVALPLLRKYDIAAVVFVPTASIGGCNDWDPMHEPPLRLMAEEQVARLAREGVEIGCHSHHHLDLSRLSEASVIRELRRSSDILRDITGRPPRYVAYPFGAVNETVERAASVVGFEAGFSMRLEDDSPLRFGRVGVDQRDHLSRLALKTSGQYHRLRRSALLRRVNTVLYGTNAGTMWVDPSVPSEASFDATVDEIASEASDAEPAGS